MFLTRNVLAKIGDAITIVHDDYEGWVGNDHRRSIFRLSLPTRVFDTKYELAFEAHSDHANPIKDAMFLCKP
ncbi:hypothetical protein IAD21_04479 [Abditibacteriota bacterium]|nr:hypothetical protein IAD21_04479 [Abditibacteriota bacterium]